MIKPLELAIGLRYTRARRRNHFISFISMISMMGIVVGVWALITVISIMNGFERELRDRILAVASHVTVSGSNGWLAEWPRVSERIGGLADIRADAPFILGQGMLTRGKAVTGAMLRGIVPTLEDDVSQLSDHLQSGSFDSLESGNYHIVIGYVLARQLGVEVGDKITVVAPQGKITPAGMLPRLRRFTVSGIFRMNMYEYDSALALTHIEDLGRLLHSEGKVSGLRLKLEDVYQAQSVNRKLTQMLGSGYYINDWTREHANFFRALKIEKRVMFVILFLVVAVAVFNIVSALVMVVADKQADIAILRTLGLSPGSVMALFVIQGTVIGLVGSLAGGVFGVLTAMNVETIVPVLEQWLGFQFFPSDIYVISDFPAEMRWPDVFIITALSFVMSIVSTLYPARRAAKVQPAEALRYE
ncbi:MAG: lipoprotein-releasing ABC transporter permease subunit [Arenicellales bacterium]|nr:lipoprotein-releasing ABC transporter permease subunit [Arenicellales bacterium]MDP6723612.1 lipoprotein-releasing ABC transporter permease subunit [Arenicellales bacterium]